MAKSKTIYFVLTYSGTVLSKIIKYYTKDEFCHISIALDDKLNEMYSFARINPYNPFWGGFVHESIHYGTFKRFKKTRAAVYALDVSKKQYAKIKSLINYMEKNKKQYKFNFLGLVAISINLELKFRNTFYCAEFVKYLMDEAQVPLNLPRLVKPIDFKYVENIKLTYQGMLQNYGS